MRLLWDDDETEEPERDTSPAKATKPASPGTEPDHPLSVSQLNAWVKYSLDESIPKVWVAGEVSDLSKPSSGHLYLTLKDQQSQIRAVLWKSSAARLGFELEDGQSILCQGQLDVYSPRGTYQLVIQRAQPQGLGALQLAFRQLHAKLAKEGLFAPERKKPLPRFPKRVGFVTSPSGAAIRDFLEVLRRRWPNVHVIVIPAKVQGSGAAADIVQGILNAQKLIPALDVLVVGRGGGSLEDLWAFNEEPVIRALAACRLPTVSAVGHEIDVTLCDLVADSRALTPSEAAERILPNAQEIIDALRTTHQRLATWMLANIARYRQRLDTIASRSVIDNPKETLRRMAQRVDEFELRSQNAIAHQLLFQRKRIDQLAATVDALSPMRVIHRGYSVTLESETGKVVSSIQQVQVGQLIKTLLADGTFLSRVESRDESPSIPNFRNGIE